MDKFIREGHTKCGKGQEEIDITTLLLFLCMKTSHSLDMEIEILILEVRNWFYL